MKRLILSLAALAAVAGPLTAAPSDALADRRDERRAERRMEREERRDDRYEGQRVPRVRPGDRRVGDRVGPVIPIPEARSRGPRGERYFVPPPASWRRGAILPPHARGSRIYTYDRHRLRPPPPGYVWYQVGRDFLLTDARTGMILEVVPGY